MPHSKYWFTHPEGQYWPLRIMRYNEDVSGQMMNNLVRDMYLEIDALTRCLERHGITNWQEEIINYRDASIFIYQKNIKRDDRAIRPSLFLLGGFFDITFYFLPGFHEFTSLFLAGNVNIRETLGVNAVHEDIVSIPRSLQPRLNKSQLFFGEEYCYPGRISVDDLSKLIALNAFPIVFCSHFCSISISMTRTGLFRSYFFSSSMPRSTA